MKKNSSYNVFDFEFPLDCFTRTPLSFAVFILTMLVYGGEVYANPEGGVVSAGNAMIQQNGSVTQINQITDKAVIDWQRFNIGVNEKTNFIQPSASSITLNRINAQNGPSSIFGNLNATGQVWLINPAGVLFGSSARVNVAGLLVTTSNISNEDFMSGNYTFNPVPGYGNSSIVNEGVITTGDYGLVALVAPGVENAGVIQARMGKVFLGSGKTYTVDFYGDQLIQFGLNAAVEETPIDVRTGQPMRDAVKNSGSVIADGGQITMTGRVAQGVVDNVVNMTGIAQARAVVQRGGDIILSGDTGVVRVSGKADVSGKSAGKKGGKIKIVSKDKVGLFDQAVLDASGNIGGGEILIGGDYQGKNPDVSDAQYTFAGIHTFIDNSAITNGDGGKTILWADEFTAFLGTINARGGELTGNGGFTEISGKNDLIFEGQVNLLAPHGQIGTLLLDPRTLNINSSGSNYTEVLASFDNNSSGTTSIRANSLNGLTGNIKLQANDTVNINASFTLGAGANLFIQSGRVINITNGVTITTSQLAGAGGNITLETNVPNTFDTPVVSAQVGSGAASITMNVNSLLRTNGTNATAGGGNVTIRLYSSGTANGNDGGFASSTGNITLGSIITNNLIVENRGQSLNSSIRRVAGGSPTLVANRASFFVTNTANNTGTVGATANGSLIYSPSANTAYLNASTQGGDIRISVTANANAGANSLLYIGGGPLNPTVGLNTKGVSAGSGNVVLSSVRSIETASSGGAVKITGLADFSLVSGVSYINLTDTNNEFVTVNVDGGSSLNVNLVDGVDGFIFGQAGRPITATEINNLTLTAAGLINFAYNSIAIAGNLVATTTANNGSITQTGGPLQVTGVGKTAIFSTHGEGSIMLTHAANSLPNIAIASALNASITSNTAINIAAAGISAAGFVNLTATGGGITQTGAINVLNNSTVVSASAGNNIILTNAANNFGTLAAANANNVNIINSGAIILGTSTISGTLNIIAGGNITQSGTLTVNGATTLVAGSTNNITLTDSANRFSTLSINNTNNASITTAGALVLGNTNLLDQLIINVDSISDTGAVSANQINIKTANGINLDQISNVSQAVFTNTTRNSITVVSNGTSALTITSLTQTANQNISLTHSGSNLTVNNITSSGTGTLNLVTTNDGQLLLNGNLAAGAGLNLTAAGGIKLMNDISLETLTGNININSALDGNNHNLSVTNNNATTLFAGVVSNLGSGIGAALYLTGNTQFNNTLTTNSGVVAHNNVTFNNNVIINGGDTISEFFGNNTLNNMTFTSNNNDVNFGDSNNDQLTLASGTINLVGTNADYVLNAKVDGAAALNLNGSSHAINADVGSLTALNSLTVNNGNLTLNANITAQQQIYAGTDLNLGTNVNLTGNTFNFNSRVNGAYNLTISSSSPTSVVNFNQNVDSNSPLNTLTLFGINTVNLYGLITAANLSGSANILNMNTAARFNTALALVNNSGTLNVLAGTYSGQVLNINKNINVNSIGGTANINQFIVSAGSTIGMQGNWNSSVNDALINGNVNLTGTTQLTSNQDIYLNGAINGNYNLALTAQDIYVNSALGNTTALNGISFFNGSGNTYLSNNVNAQGADINFNSDVRLMANTNITNSGAAINFNDTLNGNYNLILSAAGGNINFIGIVGSGPNNLNNVTVITANNVTAERQFNAATYTQLAGSGTINFIQWLSTSGNINITANNIAGRYAGDEVTLIGTNSLTGIVNVNALILGGLNGGNMTGTVNNIGGTQAAFETQLTTGAQVDFFVNGCAVGSLSCILPKPNNNGNGNNDRNNLEQGVNGVASLLLQGSNNSNYYLLMSPNSKKEKAVSASCDKASASLVCQNSKIFQFGELLTISSSH